MNIYDVGSGPPLIIVPGIQGRWEWMRRGIDALSRHYRVVTFSLCDEPTSGATCDQARGFDAYVDQIAAVMNERNLPEAIVSGVSYGGLIAAAFAARHPERVSSLVLLSALAPGWRSNARARFYLRAPRLLFPLFAVQSMRLYREMATAYGGAIPAIGPCLRHGWNVITHPASPARMARRVRLLERVDLTRELSRLKIETLVVTGEDHLDLVVPPVQTREYLALWPHATGAVLSRTGHLGVITRPDELHRIVDVFLREARTEDPAVSGSISRRKIG